MVGLGLLAAGASPAEAQNVSYSVIPTYQEIRWDDAFGFDKVRPFGVRGSLDFGPYFSLQPFYAWTDELEPRDGLTVGEDDPAAWEMQTYGADMMVNVGRGPLVPFLTGGGGILRVTPEDAERTDRLLLRYGGGLRFGLGSGLGAEITAQNWTTRLSSPFVAGAVSDDDFPEDGLVDSWVYGAGLRIPFGGDVSSAQGTRGLVPGISVEPFAARTDFADELGLDRLHAAGARAGVDFNQNVGLRAFYWRAVDDDFSEFQDAEAYGAEARFNLNTGPGLSPFLVAGAGRIRFTDEFFDVEGERPDDLDHLILGGGVSFALGDRARVELGVRDLLMTPGADLEDVTNPDEFVHSWQYSAGLSLTLGARPRGSQEGSVREREEELERLVEENRRLRAGIAVDEREDGPRAVEGDTVGGPRTLVIPVPEVGEVILRYGEAYAVRAPEGTLNAAQLEALERRIAELLAAQGVSANDTTIARLQRENLEARIPELVRQAVREEIQAMGLQPGAPAPIAVTVTDSDSARRWEVLTLEPYTGLQVDRTQLLLGMRAGMRNISPDVPIQIVPELAFGFGDGGTSLLLGINARYAHEVGGSRRFTPYVQGGVAITNSRLLSFNAGYGVMFDAITDSEGQPIRMFIEHQGIQLYRDHRLLVGASLNAP